MKKRTSIDIGSNSVLLLSVFWNENKIEKELLNCSHVTSLGKDLDKNKAFLPETMQATFVALQDYKHKLEKNHVKPAEVIVTATEAARVATNAKEFFLKVKNEIGFDVQIISEEQEAYFTALGVTSGLDVRQEDLVVMDIGGASTELIKIKRSPFEIVSSVSLPVGAVRGADWQKENSFDANMKEILSADLSEYKTETMICVAGSMTSLATMYLGKLQFNDQEVDGLIIELDQFRKFKNLVQKRTPAELLLSFPFLGKRAPMVAAGAEIATLILENLSVKFMRVSTRGLRYGVVVQGHL